MGEKRRDNLKMYELHLKENYDVVEQIYCEIEKFYESKTINVTYFFTEHLEGHSARVFKICNDLDENESKNNLTYIKLSEREKFVLAIASLFHDFSMNISPKYYNLSKYLDNNNKYYESFPLDPLDYDENHREIIRKNHASLSIAIMRYYLNEQNEPHKKITSILKSINSSILEDVYNVIKYHSGSLNGIETTGIEKMLLIFRLSDELDCGQERYNYDPNMRDDYKNLRGKAYWLLNKITKVEITQENIINITIDINHKDSFFKRVLECYLTNFVIKNEEIINRLYRFQMRILLIKDNCKVEVHYDDSYEKIEADLRDELLEISKFNEIKTENEEIAFYKKHLLNGYELKCFTKGIIPGKNDSFYNFYEHRLIKVNKKTIYRLRLDIIIEKKLSIEDMAEIAKNIDIRVFFRVNKISNETNDVYEAKISAIWNNQNIIFYDMEFKPKNDDFFIEIKKDDQVEIFCLYKFVQKDLNSDKTTKVSISPFFEDFIGELIIKENHNKRINISKRNPANGEYTKIEHINGKQLDKSSLTILNELFEKDKIDLDLKDTKVLSYKVFNKSDFSIEELPTYKLTMEG